MSTALTMNCDWEIFADDLVLGRSVVFSMGAKLKFVCGAEGDFRSYPAGNK